MVREFYIRERERKYDRIKAQKLENDKHNAEYVRNSRNNIKIACISEGKHFFYFYN